MKKNPIIKDVVLIGGGHSHSILIRQWAMQPLAGVRLTLISENVLTPYSGMLPGLVAGHYTHDEVHIDLLRLCQWAGVRFIKARLEAIDLAKKQLRVNADRPAIAFDVLSLDTGSTPELSVTGSEQHSVAVKPVNEFYAHWESLRNSLDAAQKPVKLGVVGSGAGGLELVMAMQHALRKSDVHFHWIIRGQAPLKNRPNKVKQLALDAVKAAGIQVHSEFDVTRLSGQSIYAKDGREIELDEVIWCTGARAPEWPKLAGLDTDDKGFVLTNAHLQSISHNFVFATGDIGTQQHTPSAKAGVFAVRQAPYLFQNIRRYLLGNKLKSYRPQRDFLSLMATGAKSAIASRNRFAIDGRWVWRWKNQIDQKFMQQFRELPKLSMSGAAFSVHSHLISNSNLQQSDVAEDAMRCNGCGAKVSSSVLERVLLQLNPVNKQGVVAGFEARQDAAVLDIHSELLVQSVDQLSALIDDPYLFGRIAAVHALSDVYTAQASAHSAQALVTLPFADEQIVERDLTQLMSGVVDALNADNCSLLGGHSAEGEQLQLGFVVNGVLSSNPSQANIEQGDALVLTKPLGTGILLAGLMQQLSAGEHVYAAINSMLQSNRLASEIFKKHGAKQITDITGFGLLTHLCRLLDNTALSAELMADDVPLLPGVIALAEQQVQSTLLSHNQSVLHQISMLDNGNASRARVFENILCDPQTSGGLLAVVPVKDIATLLENLHAAGYSYAAKVGKVVNSDSTIIV